MLSSSLNRELVRLRAVARRLRRQQRTIKRNLVKLREWQSELAVWQAGGGRPADLIPNRE
jgi:hypothetical protein